jgi:hypothetical protein
VHRDRAAPISWCRRYDLAALHADNAPATQANVRAIRPRNPNLHQPNRG